MKYDEYLLFIFTRQTWADYIHYMPNDKVIFCLLDNQSAVPPISGPKSLFGNQLHVEPKWIALCPGP